MLDIIIYLCGNHVKDLFGESWFSIEDFCKKMGYDRTKLQRKLSQEQMKDLFGKRSPHYIFKDANGEEIIHPVETVFEAALYKLGLENISYPVVANGTTSYIFIQILTKFEIKTNFKTKKGTKRLYSASLNNLIKDSVYTLYNLIESQDYRILPNKYRYFYLELSKMIFLIKYKIRSGSLPSYRLTVDQLAKLFNLNFEENKERKTKMKVAVLAVQGAFIEHEKSLQRLGAETVELRKAEDLEQDFDGLVLPGGESTVQSRLLKELSMFEPLKEKIEEGLPVLATCAGLILLAQNVSNDEKRGFATLPVTVKRNAYGRQLGSFYYEGGIKGIGTYPMEFIRAPYIESVGDDVEILAEVEEKIVGVAYKNQLAFSFHPELTGNDKIHEKFLELIKVSNN